MKYRRQKLPKNAVGFYELAVEGHVYKGSVTSKRIATWIYIDKIDISISNGRRIAKIVFEEVK
jgi:hypothetical protein